MLVGGIRAFSSNSFGEQWATKYEIIIRILEKNWFRIKRDINKTILFKFFST